LIAALGSRDDLGPTAQHREVLLAPRTLGTAAVNITRANGLRESSNLHASSEQVTG
jgi:hypothetical protein